MAKQIPQTEKRAERKKAASVVAAVELMAVQLIECAMRQRLTEGKLPDHIHNTVNVEIGLSDDRTKVTAQFKCSVSGTYEPISKKIAKEEIPFLIGGIFHVFYNVTADADLDPDHLTAFGQQTGLFTVWPYWRELVQSLSSRSGLPPLTVPLLKLAEVVANQSPAEPLTRPKRAKKRR